jgi:hypothetical protein
METASMKRQAGHLRADSAACRLAGQRVLISERRLSVSATWLFFVFVFADN